MIIGIKKVRLVLKKPFDKVKELIFTVEEENEEHFNAKLDVYACGDNWYIRVDRNLKTRYNGKPLRWFDSKYDFHDYKQLAIVPKKEVKFIFFND